MVGFEMIKTAETSKAPSGGIVDGTARLEHSHLYSQ